MSKPLHSPDYQVFLQELRAAREAAAVSQIELGRRIGEDQAFVSKVERGIRRLDVIELRRWAEALGIGLAEFIEHLERRLERSRLAAPSRGLRRSGRKT